MKEEHRKEVTGALVWAAVMLALALGATYAHRQGYIDRELVTRLTSCVLGLWMVWYGNRIPKRFTPSDCARQVQRVAAWSQVLSGLVFTGLWIFAPVPVALTAGTLTVFAGVAVTFGYCLTTQTKAKAS